MKVYTTEQIRNVAIAGHSGSGKTSLAEAILYTCKVIDRMGKTEDGNTQSDFLPEETRRGISISASVLPVEVGQVKVNLVDLPGFRDFVGEIKGGMKICGGVVIVVDAMGGYEVGTEFALQYAREMELPVAFFINKLDKENSSYEKALESIRSHIEGRLIEMTLPIGRAEGFRGVVDLIRMKSFIEKGGKLLQEEIPEEMAAQAAQLHEESIVDQAASGDESLAEKFLNGEELNFEEVALGLKNGFFRGEYYPVYCGSSTHGIGVQSLLDFMEIGFPNPHQAHGLRMVDKSTGEPTEAHFTEGGPITLFVYKTLSDKFGDHNFFKVVSGHLKRDTSLRNMTSGKDERISHIFVQRGKGHEEVEELCAGDLGAVTKMQTTHTNDTLVSSDANWVVTPPDYPQRTVVMALHAITRGDEDKLGEAVKKLVDLDPTLEIRRDVVLHQTLLAGMGDMHLDVLVSRVKALAKVECVLEIPRTAYRETIQGKAEGSYRHKKQSGGRGQFGEVHLRIMPNVGGAGLEFRWKIVGGVIPSKYETAIRKGVEQSMEKGVIAGYPFVDAIVECFDGKQHDVDSSDMAFMLAASMCFRQVAQQAKPIILEPISKLKTTVPEQYLGDVMGDISGKRGRILGQEMNGSKLTIEAQVPQSELYEYSKHLRSMTQGRGVFEVEFDHYDRVPADVQAKLIDAFEGHKDEE